MLTYNFCYLLFIIILLIEIKYLPYYSYWFLIVEVVPELKKWACYFFFAESLKTKSDSEKSSQPKAVNSTSKLNGEGSIANEDSKKDKIGTKEPILNGSEKACEKIVNGDPKNQSDCDISSSNNAKVVTNGINSDSDDTKSIKSDGGNDTTVPATCPIKILDGKQNGDKKKENKKVKVTDKNNETCKAESVLKENAQNSKEEEVLNNVNKESDKMNGDSSKVVNGDKDRESTPSEDDDDKKRDPEVLFIQDMGFTVKIVSPGTEPLDIQVILTRCNISLKIKC